MQLYETAVAMALAAHEGQVRKTDGSPYIVHPLTVAYLVSRHTKDEVVIAAAVLHDVLEDSSLTKAELTKRVGDEVTRIVEAVTEDKQMPWEERKEAYVKSVLAGGEAVWLVSVADKIHNATSLHRELTLKGPVVWESFNRGRDKKLWFENLLLTELKARWQHPLLVEYEALILAIQKL